MSGPRTHELSLGVGCLIGVMLMASTAWAQVQVDNDPTVALGWTLQFSDDFGRTKPGADWQVVSGDWKIADRTLQCVDPGLLLCTWRFSGSVRLEFDAVATGESISDLSAVLNATQGGRLSDGYFFGFGSEKNTASKLLVKGREVTRYDARIVPGKRYRVVCQREGGTLTHMIDGRVVMTVEDDTPIVAPEHNAVGLYNWAGGAFDDVRVYTKDGSASRAPSGDARLIPATGATKTFGFELKDPLFEELFGDTPGPTRFFSYSTKYDGRETGDGSRRKHRATAKRFGMRYVFEEQLKEAAENNFISFGKMSEPLYKKYGIATRSYRPVDHPRGMTHVALPDGSLPYVFGTYGWLMDPRFLDHLVSEIEQRAREREYWCVVQFDEIFTGYAIKPIPKDKWYKEVEEADKEIREKYGFGKYGMPESVPDGDPFDRIAQRRWASDKLTETFARAYKAAKAVNPQMRLVGPTHGSNATSADMEAWAPYFDILGGQCGGGGSNCMHDWVRPGANTKLYVDLTGKPIWMMVHLAKHHAKERDPEYIREMYSQVFRNGGQGLWLMSREFFVRALEDAMFAEPAKWRAMLELSKTIRAMRLPRLPEPDCAILFSSESTYTTTYGGLSYHNDQVISAYTVVGPCLRSWPQFVTDRQIMRGDRDLSAYKVLYIPYSAYQSTSLLDKIKSYVRAGGLVVCTDTDAFTWNINGDRFGEQWDEFTGVHKTGPRNADAVMKTVTPNPLPLSGPIGLTALVPGSRIEPLNDKVVTIAVFDDGSPAVTLHPYGEGNVIFFAADPLYAVGQGKAKKSVVALDSPIVRLMEAIQKSAGVKMGHDIWRFKLPPYKIDVYQKETDLCLTGNYVYDANEPLLEPNNLQTGGTYTYSRAPTAVADTGEAGEAIPFDGGHLTNRLNSYETLKRGRRPSSQAGLDKVTSQWIVGWDDVDPIGVTFDLKGEHPLSKIRLFYSGTMPAVKVSGSRDGNTWKELASNPEEAAGEDVKDVALALDGRYQYVRLNFAGREGGGTFELCEVEIWGEPAK